MKFALNPCPKLGMKIDKCTMFKVSNQDIGIASVWR